MDSDTSSMDFSDSSSDYKPPENESSTSDSEDISDLNQVEPVPASTSPLPGPSRTNQEDDQANSDRGRKRTKNENTWKKTKRKHLRNSGLAYNSVKGQAMLKKVFKNGPCHCRKRCNEKFTEAERRRIFESFWKLGDFSKQNVYIRSSVLSHRVRRKRIRDGSASEKNISYTYVLRDGANSQTVCKKYFLETLQLSHGRVYRCISKTEVHAVIDSRGKGVPKNKHDDTDIIAHINSFPAYQSHYSRKKNPERKYLHPDLNIRKLYDLYVEKCNTEGKQPLKQKFYYHVFSTKFNLHFKVPAKDTCSRCDELQLKIEAATDDLERRSKFEVEKKLHLAKAVHARESLKTDKDAASNSCYVATFDLQKALPYPKLTTSIAYYKRNMYIYNFGIHSFNKNNGYMHLWDETEGGRGSQEVASLLAKHIRHEAKNHTHVILYSDSCTGQNRNIKVASTLMNLVLDPKLSIKVIDHKFLVSGHSFLPNDQDFGVIESASRKCIQIFTPEDWLQVVKKAKTKKPFEVFKVNTSDILSTKKLEEMLVNRKKTDSGEPVKWLEMRWMRYEREEPWTLQFKNTLNKIVAFSKVTMSTKNSKFCEKQDPLYKTARVVTEAKKKDMMSLLPFLPPNVHGHFKGLRTEKPTRSQTALNEENISESDDDEPIFNDA